MRLELQASQRDVALIRSVAEMLRGNAERAQAVRSALANALTDPEVKTAFDIFGSELADEAFTGIFDQPRRRDGREVGP